MKRLCITLLATIFLCTCVPAMAETTSPDIRLAQTSIDAMSYTVESLTETIRVLASLLEQSMPDPMTFDEDMQSTTKTQFGDMYDKIEYEAYLKALEAQMQAFDNENSKDISKEMYNDILKAIQDPNNTDESINDLIKDCTEFINRYKTEIENATEEDTIENMNDFLNEILKNSENTEELPPPPEQNPLVGGWTILTDPTITDAMLNMVTTATADMSDMAIEPIACLGTQLVAGENFCYFCKADHQGEPGDAYTQYILLYVYVDLNGNAEVLGWAPINPGGIARTME